MLKGSELINRKLITRDAGELVGKVRDLVVDQTGSRVWEYWSKRAGWAAPTSCAGRPS